MIGPPSWRRVVVCVAVATAVSTLTVADASAQMSLRDRLRNLFRRQRPKPVDIKDPKPLSKHPDARYTRARRNSLFRKGPSWKDVCQGSIADCYLAGALTEVAYQQPDLIRQAIRRNDDDTFTVRLFPGAGRRPVKVRVDADLPTRNGKLLYARSPSPRERWVSLIEKAYAQHRGSYEAIGNGGSAGAVFTALTGKPSSQTSVSPGQADRLFTRLEQHLRQRKFAVGYTFDDPNKTRYANTGLWGDHTYAIWNVAVFGGRKYVQLRNPWGSGEPSRLHPEGNSNTKRGDGIFTIPLDEFAQQFESVVFGG